MSLKVARGRNEFFDRLMSIRGGNKMRSRIRHRLIISLTVIALFFAVEYGYGAVIEYTYDEAGNLIGRGIQTLGTITINSGAASTNRERI
jgi:hypothetical protein